MPVYLTYLTVNVEEGKLAFATDVYGLDPAPAALAATDPAKPVAEPAETATASAPRPRPSRPRTDGGRQHCLSADALAHCPAFRSLRSGLTTASLGATLGISGVDAIPNVARIASPETGLPNSQP